MGYISVHTVCVMIMKKRLSQKKLNFACLKPI